jgi:hypothetical protein
MTAAGSITLLVVIVREFPKNKLTLPGKIVVLGVPVGGAQPGRGAYSTRPRLRSSVA